MRRTVLGSCTKFCPSRFVGRSPSSPARARTSAGPNSRDRSSVTPGECTSPLCVVSPGQPELVRARRPGPVVAPVVADLAGDRDLLLAAGLVGQRRVVGAAVGAPGAGIELQAAVVAVAPGDPPVAGGLAVGESIP